ncbi:MAG TPA: class IV adenylate cyclase [Candidatus Polarisedimenticolaceae bacterium]|nr:class IV adenylate cyclase [Candidatus Polarisedimenticolaceae bacterium]
MAKSSRENEIKLAFPSPESALRKLLAAGARPLLDRAFEDNVLYDFEDGALRSSGRLLRLRLVRGSALLTLKAEIPGEHRHKLRAEHETEVRDADALREILSGLGLAPVYRYQKYRTTFRLPAVEASLDETPLGTFVELEGPPDSVDAAARRLGASDGEFIRATYRDLQERDAEVRGTVAGDLLMPRPETHDPA